MEEPYLYVPIEKTWDWQYQGKKKLEDIQRVSILSLISHFLSLKDYYNYTQKTKISQGWPESNKSLSIQSFKFLL